MKLLFQQDFNEPIGVWLEFNEDGRGLHARGRLMPEVTRAREVLSLMRTVALDGLSIGFRTVQGRTDPASGERRLDKIVEISVVTFPTLLEARILTVKWRAGRRAARGDLSHLARSFRRGAANWKDQRCVPSRTHRLLTYSS